MALYTCPSCGMAVKTDCGTCDDPLVDSVVVTAAGAEVRISECPNGHGKIKSPMCCGNDMGCAA
ncbi:MAG: hypothetical protein EXQ81_09095 [Thermoleophilia bacterium]|nr:hypothetical protein [Thermoleophilia bacterium]